MTAIDAIRKAYRQEPHAFVLGCGKETLSHVVKSVSGVRISAGKIRQELVKACERGEFVAGVSPLGYKTFIKDDSK